MQPNLMEIMSSIQGEGLFVGERQIFIRLAGCNLRCSYCDTPGSFDYLEPCRVEVYPGSGEISNYPNPMPIETLIQIIRQYQPELHHSLSITGGEPLLFTDYIKEIAPILNSLGLKVFIETNGTLPNALSKIGQHIDIISMDIKIPSTSGTKAMWKEHREFLDLADKLPVVTYVKVVVANSSTEAELRMAAQLVADINPEIPLILQPVTPLKNSNLLPPEAEQLLNMHRIFREYLQNVRIIPQTHKMLKVL